MKLCPPLLDKIKHQLLIAKYPKPGPTKDKVMAELLDQLLHWEMNFTPGMALAWSSSDGSSRE